MLLSVEVLSSTIYDAEAEARTPGGKGVSIERGGDSIEVVRLRNLRTIFGKFPKYTQIPT